MALSILATSPRHERRNNLVKCEQHSLYQPAHGIALIIEIDLQKQ